MKKEVIVLSLGGSLIIPEKVNTSYLKQFKKIIQKNTNKYKFVIVCGGGSLARKYISSLEEIKLSHTFQSLAGIASTRINARFMSYFFKQDPKKGIPHKMREVKRQIKKQDIIFCGALEYKPDQTSDSTSAQIAKKLNAKFINLTNVQGLYDKDPNQLSTEAKKKVGQPHKKGRLSEGNRRCPRKARLIKEISWKDFHTMANKIKFKPGQHFVLDQNASKIILENKITTYIIGQNPKQLDNLLKNKNFIGTKIQD